jgi:hypothetical protein
MFTTYGLIVYKIQFIIYIKNNKYALKIYLLILF